MIVDEKFRQLRELKVNKLLTEQTGPVRGGVDRHEVTQCADQLRALAKRLHDSGATLLAQRTRALAVQADQEVKRREMSPWLK